MFGSLTRKNNLSLSNEKNVITKTTSKEKKSCNFSQFLYPESGCNPTLIPLKNLDVKNNKYFLLT